MNGLYPVIPLAPLAGAILAGFFGRLIGRTGAHVVTILGVLVAFVCSVLAMSLFLSGLLKVKNWEASLLSMAEPITGVAVGILFLNESLSGAQWVGVALVLAALTLVSIPVKTRQ